MTTKSTTEEAARAAAQDADLLEFLRRIGDIPRDDLRQILPTLNMTLYAVTAGIAIGEHRHQA